MSTYRHVYRCRCGDWDQNRIELYTSSETAPFKRLQHFTLRANDDMRVVGLNETCQNYLTWLTSFPYANALPANSLVDKKVARKVTTSDALGPVVLGPDLLVHVFRGQLNGGTATGYHSTAETKREGAAPWKIADMAHKLAEFEMLSRPDEWGAYYARYKLQYPKGNETLTTAWKISAMFSDAVGKSVIERAIKTAAVNKRTDGSKSVDWAGVNDNGQRIGGRSDGTGRIESAFPAYRGSFDIPESVDAKFKA